MGIGTYALIDKFNSGEGLRLENVVDVIVNIAFLMIVIGGVVFIVSFAGCIGALRENVCLLKFYSLCLLIFFLAEMGLAGLGNLRQRSKLRAGYYFSFVRRTHFST